MSRPFCGLAAAIVAGLVASVWVWPGKVSSAQPAEGYWMAGADGGVFAFGAAEFQGSLAAVRINAPIVGIIPTPSGRGYWLAAADGGVFAFGDARFFGSAGDLRLAAPITAIERTPAGDGYWLLGRDGGIFAFGAAGFYGVPHESTRTPAWGHPALASVASGRGYWMVTNSPRGGVSVAGFGNAPVEESQGILDGSGVDVVLNAAGTGWVCLLADGSLFARRPTGVTEHPGQRPPTRIPLTAIDRSVSVKGFWVAAEDGGVFTYGDAPFLGSLGALRLNSPIVDLASRR